MSRSSVFHNKGRDVDLQTVAKDLKVERVITGRIVQRGDQLVIGAELIDARTNRSLWGDQYNRKLSDVLTVQEDITRAISSKLRERLSGETKKPVAKGGTNDPEAYQLYLKGRYYWEKRTPEALEKSKDYFDQAIEKDPGYAMAYVGLADYYVVVPDYEPLRRTETAPKAIAAAKKALVYLTDLGRGEEARVQLMRALEKDPLNLTVLTNLASCYQSTRQYELALKYYNKAIEIDPNFVSAHDNLAATTKAADLFGDKDELAVAKESTRTYAKGEWRSALKKT